MKQRKLGTNGPSVGAIGLGCMSFAGFYGPTDTAESHRALSAAVDCGMTHLDTSNVYGMGVSEAAIGSFMASNPHAFVIASKAGIHRTPDGERTFNNDPKHLRGELEKSLKRLGVDHIALYYIHRRDQNIPVEDVMGTMLDFQSEGKIGGIGFSEISPATLRRAAKVAPVMAVQSEYSLWSRMPDLGMIDACREVGTAFVPFSPLARGMFAETCPDPSSFKSPDFRATGPRFIEPNFSANVAHFDRFRDLAHDLGVKTASLAIAWVLDRGDHLIPIPGTRSAEHVLEIAQGADITMTDDIRTRIDAIMPVGFAHGDRYSDAQLIGVERYC